MKSLYCVNAEHGFCTKPTGDIIPCCISMEKTLNDQGEPAVLNKDLPMDVWRGQYLTDLRQALKNGQYHPNCQQCWGEEAAGLDSKRLRDNRRWAQLVDEPMGDYPKLLDLSLGNTCNLACRSCNPSASSRWYKEAQRSSINQRKAIPDDRIYFKKLNDQISASYDDQAPIWDFLHSTIPDVLHIDFYGGEPMLVKRHWEMLSEVPLEKAKNISLHFNTNGTQWDEDYVDVLKRFKAVIIDISIDGTEDMFEYMRWPAKWDEVNENIKKFKQLSEQHPQISIGICITLSILNTWRLPETLDYANSIGVSCYLNLLHGPIHYNLQTLHPKARDVLLERLETVEHGQIEGIRQFIRAATHNPAALNDLFRITQDHDMLRNQSLKKLVPEWVEAIVNV